MNFDCKFWTIRYAKFSENTMTVLVRLGDHVFEVGYDGLSFCAGEKGLS
jgi:hypothetical protein